MGTLWSLVLLLCFFVNLVDSRGNHPDTFLEELFERVSREQVHTNQPFKPFRSWQKSKGAYSSNILPNFHGRFPMAAGRHFIHIFDNNMFVMAWVTLSLLEAFKYGGVPRPTDEQLILTLNALKEHHDKNKLYNTSIMTFWQQTYNRSTNHWECKPVNFIETFHFLDILPLRFIETFLRVVGLGELAQFLQNVMKDKSALLSSFHIPPDFDDTFVNMALGSLLLEQKDDFPVAWKLWKSHNTNLTSVFEALKKYAYRPFSADTDLNSIDPRTYYHIRGFLDLARTNGQDIALVPTWIQSIGEERHEISKGTGMPFAVNNVDVTVAANFIFGITSTVLSGLVGAEILSDPIIAQIYLNTTSLIAYEIANNFSGRPDLALTYYPSCMEFYWFVARTVDKLESSKKNGTLPLKVMEDAYHILRNVTDSHLTSNILSMANKEGTDKVYFDDFLGDGDLTYDGRPLKRGEDRIFTTAMAANSLLSAWTYFESTSGKYRWIKGTSEAVQQTVLGCVKWLRQHTLDGKYYPWNAFFSGSSKSFQSLPFWYPGNRLEFINGTNITDWSSVPNSTFIYAVQGYVPADKYNAMLKEKHFGFPTPTKFDGYNNDSNVFPLWSSDPYTYSTTMLAVSRFGNIIG